MQHATTASGPSYNPSWVSLGFYHSQDASNMRFHFMHVNVTKCQVKIKQLRTHAQPPFFVYPCRELVLVGPGSPQGPVTPKVPACHAGPTPTSKLIRCVSGQLNFPQADSRMHLKWGKAGHPTKSGHGTLGGTLEVCREATVVGVSELICPLIEFTRDMSWSKRTTRKVELPNEFHQNGCGTGFHWSQAQKRENISLIATSRWKTDTASIRLLLLQEKPA